MLAMPPTVDNMARVRNENQAERPVGDEQHGLPTDKTTFDA